MSIATGVDAANFDILYPLQTLKPIASLLRSQSSISILLKMTSPGEEKMEEAVLEVPLKVNATLSEPIVNLSKLLRLNVGNISLEIPISDKIDVYVEDIKMFNGDLGEYKGNSAVNVKKRI